MSFELTDESIEIASKNINKLSENMTKMGYGDGKSDGNDSIFQRDFDIGYRDSFKNAFQIGKYKGIIAAKKSQKNWSNEQNTFYENSIVLLPELEHCQSCKNPKILDTNLSEIIKVQKLYDDKLTTTLNEEKYIKLN